MKEPDFVQLLPELQSVSRLFHSLLFPVLGPDMNMQEEAFGGVHDITELFSKESCLELPAGDAESSADAVGPVRAGSSFFAADHILFSSLSSYWTSSFCKTEFCGGSPHPRLKLSI